MSNSIQINFTWKGAFKLGLGIIAEAAMLALIEDAPASVKAATLVCSVLALGTLQFEEQLRSVNARHLFRNILITLGIIYSAFVVYAVVHALDRISNQRQLRTFYIEAGTLIARDIPKEANSSALSQAEIQKLDKDRDAWEKKTSSWITRNLGDVAEARFSDVSNSPFSEWVPKSGGFDPTYSNIIKQLIGHRKNLAVLIETTAYEN